jgi:FHA domain
MKLFSKILSKKAEPQDAFGSMDLEMDVEPLRRREGPVADDSGQINRSKTSAAAEDPFEMGPKKDMILGEDEPDPAPDPAPEAMASGWDDEEWDDEDWDDDEEWGEGDEPELNAADADLADKAHLVDEIREAMGAVSHVMPDEKPDLKAMSKPRDDSQIRNWADDEEFGRKAIARSQLGSVGGAAENRLLEKTEFAMTDRETSRRRSAMAHLKAAAMATKADRVLKHVATRDPAGDPEEQSPYRDDLAKVVRPHSASRPISRQVSRSNPTADAWDMGEGDEDAALFAAATGDDLSDDVASIEEELSAAEEERLARAPIDLSEDEFTDDSVFTAEFEDEEVEEEDADDFPNSPFARSEDDAYEENAFSASDEDDLSNDDDFDSDGDDDLEADENDDDTPKARSVVSEAVAFANAPEEVEEQDEAEVRRKIWELADDVATEVEREREPEPENFVNVAPAVAGRAGRSAGRVKTRLLGFQASEPSPADLFAENGEKPVSAPSSKFPAGWIVVISGPGRGSCFSLHNGVSQIGRGEEQAIRLDFGDSSISRNNHAAVAYDDEQGKFFLGHGGKSNLVRLNGKPVLSTEEMSNGDQIRIGETTLKFVALCGEDFTWAGSNGDTATNA